MFSYLFLVSVFLSINLLDGLLCPNIQLYGDKSKTCGARDCSDPPGPDGCFCNTKCGN